MAEKDGNNNDKNEDMKNIAEPFLSLKRCKGWLEHQKLDYQSELNRMRQVEKEELEGHDEEPDIEELCESIAQLEKQYLEVSTTKSTKCYILERLLESYVKMKMLFADEEEEPIEEEFVCNVEEQQRLCRDVLKYRQALAEEEDALRDLERERIETTALNERLRRKLQDFQARKHSRKTEKESKTESSLRQQIVERENMIEVARNIYQALIFGSGVDWAEDKELRETVISCGQPLNLLDT